MTKDEIAAILKMVAYHENECGGLQACCDMATTVGTKAILDLIAAIAEEREACAKVAERTAPPDDSTAWTGNSAWAHAQIDIAAAIRART